LFIAPDEKAMVAGRKRAEEEGVDPGHGGPDDDVLRGSAGDNDARNGGLTSINGPVRGRR
jgi:hypothetical protein